MWSWFTWNECAQKRHERCLCSCSAMSCSHPEHRCCSGGTTIYLIVCRVVQLSCATLIVISAVLTTFCIHSSVSGPSVFISLICCLCLQEGNYYLKIQTGIVHLVHYQKEKSSKVILNPLKLNTFHFHQFINKRKTLIFYCASMEGLDSFLLHWNVPNSYF